MGFFRGQDGELIHTSAFDPLMDTTVADKKRCPACGRSFDQWETTGGPPPCTQLWTAGIDVNVMYPGCMLADN